MRRNNLYIVLSIVVLSLLYGYTSEAKYPQSNQVVRRDTISQVSSLTELRAQSENTVIMQCRLMGQDLTTSIQKELANYTILELNLSGCKLDSFDSQKLPKGLVSLDVSNNHLKGELEINSKIAPKIKVLNCSRNRLQTLRVTRSVVHLDASHNDLRKLILLNDYDHDSRYPHYLDVSYNWHMNYVVGFPIEKVDTLFTHKAARGRTLVQGYVDGLRL